MQPVTTAASLPMTQHPVAATAVRYPVTQSQVAPTTQTAPAAATGGNFVALLENMWTGIVNFFRGLFGRPNQSPANPGTPTSGVAPTPVLNQSPLTADDATLAQQYGLMNTPENVRNFRETLARQMAEAGAMGPGSANREAVGELQALLVQWGFTVAKTGEFDLQTANALMQWKAQAGVVESFQFTNGAPGVTPIVDTRTRSKMIEVLTAAQPATPINGLPSAPPPPPPALPPVAPVPPPAPLSVAPVTVAGPTPVVPAPAPVVAQPSGDIPATSDGVPQPLPAAGTPDTTPDEAAANPQTALEPEQLELVNRFGLLATRENIAAFIAAVERLRADTGAIGPEQQDTPDAINELQQVLTLLGYPVPSTGTLDEATQQALMAYKRANQLHESFQLADGSPGALPWVDQRTRDALIAELSQRPAS